MEVARPLNPYLSKNALGDLLWPLCGIEARPSWQPKICMIQYSHGTGWEADDRKGLGCHRGSLVAFAIDNFLFFQKINRTEQTLFRP